MSKHARNIYIYMYPNCVNNRVHTSLNADRRSQRSSNEHRLLLWNSILALIKKNFCWQNYCHPCSDALVKIIIFKDIFQCYPIALLLDHNFNNSFMFHKLCAISSSHIIIPHDLSNHSYIIWNVKYTYNVVGNVGNF